LKVVRNLETVKPYAELFLKDMTWQRSLYECNFLRLEQAVSSSWWLAILEIQAASTGTSGRSPKPRRGATNNNSQDIARPRGAKTSPNLAPLVAKPSGVNDM
jgi:hypothetical protein